MDDDFCWVCGEEFPEVITVIKSHDTSLQILHERGLLDFGLHSELNQIALCPTCERAFHTTIDPRLFFIPTDLDYFINAELKYRAHRDRARRRGEKVKGRIPTAQEYLRHQIDQGVVSNDSIGGLYTWFSLSSQSAIVRSGKDRSGEKQWQGAPFASLRCGIAILGSCRIDMLPDEVIDKLQILRDLYLRDDELRIEAKYNLQRPTETDGENMAEGDGRMEKKHPESEASSMKRVLRVQHSATGNGWKYGSDSTSHDAMMRLSPGLSETKEGEEEEDVLRIGEVKDVDMRFEEDWEEIRSKGED